MLNIETKRHIDNARDILVGVVPVPTSQIEQITNALIYKFMDDMDQASIRIGGDPAFFIQDLEPYAWSRLMSERMGSQERMNLYRDALTKFSTAKQLPDLFRDIFRSAYLPYNSPEVLDLFLKEISYFDYKHSEELGNAYEYLLSIMGSQGDAGMFRTPRHIIDFVVDVVNPTKDDKVLDPACGTAGFLISAYKHIIEQHDGKDDPNKAEVPLTPEQRKRLFNNFEGYDVSPEMVKLSKVNMYLHQFRNPQIFAYNTLTSEERWNDKYDVILANPPFMTARGGVKTHSRFSVNSKQAEVLFVDYIMNHLRPKGRAGIIVPEGIIFKSDKAYKQLRKNLVEDGLYAVVSLPSGVFNPYAGVKTSILLFDNTRAKETDELLFVKIENDGYDLGAQRRPITKNDLPEALEVLAAWRNSEKKKSSLALWVTKAVIVESGDYNLSATRYFDKPDHSDSSWPHVTLEGIFTEIKNGKNVNQFDEPGKYKVSRIQTIAQGVVDLNKTKYTNDEVSEDSFLQCGDILFSHINSIEHLAKTAIFNIANERVVHGINLLRLRPDRTKIIPEFALAMMKSINFVDNAKRYAQKAVNQASINSTSIKKLTIPLPPLEVQQQIVAELDGYQKIIDGARQIVDNWKPSFVVDPEWPMVTLPDMAENHDSKRKPVTKSDRVEGPYPYYGASGIVDYVTSYIFDGDYLLISEDGANLLARSTPIAFSVSGKTWVNNHAHILKFNNQTTQRWVEIYINQIDISRYVSGMAQPKLNQQALNSIEIPLPPLEVQQQIVDAIEAERAHVESARALIDLYTQKTTFTIAKLWSE